MSTITNRTLSLLNELIADMPEGLASSDTSASPDADPTTRDTLKRIRRALSDNRSAAADFHSHVANLAEISRLGDQLPLKAKEDLLKAFTVSSKHRAVAASLTSEASFRLAALGIMPIAAMLADGESLKSIAKRLQVPFILLTHFCNLPEHIPAMKLANTARAINAADTLYDRAVERGDATALKSMQWLAERLAPNIYAKPSESEAPSEVAHNHLNIVLDITPAAVNEGVEKRRATYDAAVKSLPSDQSSVSDALEAVFSEVVDGDIQSA